MSVPLVCGLPREHRLFFWASSQRLAQVGNLDRHLTLLAQHLADSLFHDLRAMIHKAMNQTALAEADTRRAWDIREADEAKIIRDRANAR